MCAGMDVLVCRQSPRVFRLCAWVCREFPSTCGFVGCVNLQVCESLQVCGRKCLDVAVSRMLAGAADNGSLMGSNDTQGPKAKCR